MRKRRIEIKPPPENESDLRQCLVFGIGNSGRSDDGLGWAFLDRVQRDSTFAGQIEYRYQLQIEDAAQIRDAKHVLFVDSIKQPLPDGFIWKPCAPLAQFEFTSHLLHPGAVVHLCQSLYGKRPRADLLLIQGVCWDLKTGLSGTAQHHLESAFALFEEKRAGWSK